MYQLRQIFLCIMLGACALNAQIITSWGNTISSGGTYWLANNISGNSSTSPAITITGMAASTSITINCQGYSITDTNSSPSQPIIYAHSNGSGAVVHVLGCPITTPNAGQTAAGLGFIDFEDTGLDIENVGSTYSTFTNTEVFERCSSIGFESPFATVKYGQFTDGTIVIVGCTVDLENNTMSGFTPYNASSVGSAITVENSTSPTIYNNTITGPQNGSGSNLLDDGILMVALSGAVTSYPSITENKVTHVFDLGIEFEGPVQNGTITDNTLTDTLQGAVGGYYYTSLANNNISYNNLVITRAQNNPVINFGFQSSATIPNPYFYNNRFDDNTVSGIPAYASSSVFGSANQGKFTGGYYGNEFWSDNLGTVAYFDTNSGITDGGRNLCTLTVPSGMITCH